MYTKLLFHSAVCTGSVIVEHSQKQENEHKIYTNE